MTSKALFDETELVERLLGDRDLARAIVAVFVDDCPKQLAALQSHLNAGDAAAAVRQAHGIRGAAANVGTPGLEEAARAMEEAGSARDLGAMAAHLPELKRQYHAARAVMRSIQPARAGADEEPT